MTSINIKIKELEKKLKIAGFEMNSTGIRYVRKNTQNTEYFYPTKNKEYKTGTSLLVLPKNKASSFEKKLKTSEKLVDLFAIGIAFEGLMGVGYVIAALENVENILGTVIAATAIYGTLKLGQKVYKNARNKAWNIAKPYITKTSNTMYDSEIWNPLTQNTKNKDN